MPVHKNAAGVRFGLRAKFVAAFAIPIILVALLLVGIQRFLVRRAMIEQTIDQGAAIAQTIEATAGYYVIFGLTDDLKGIVTKIDENPSVEYAEFLDGSGKVMAATAPKPPTVLVNRKLQRERGELAGNALHVYNVPFFETTADAANPAAAPKGYFRLLLNESRARQAINSMQRWNVLITTLILVLATILAWFASRP